MKPIDPLQLQRLVDGELDSRQVQQVLTEAKSAPAQWEEIAVGFVESQLWNEAFVNDSNGSNHSNAGGAAIADSGLASKPETRIVSGHGSKDSRSSSPFSWLVMAASLIVAATIGFMVSQIQNRDLPGNKIAEAESDTGPMIASNSESLGTQPIKVSDPEQPRMTKANYHLEVPQEQFDELGSAGPVAPVPLIAVNNANDLRELNLFHQRHSQTVSDEMLKQLVGSGYQLKQDVNYISGQLDDGRSFVVPVRTTRFVSGQ